MYKIFTFLDISKYLMYNDAMKDIELVKKLLLKHNISNAEYARSIGATRQQVNNWFDGNGIPKHFLLPTANYLKKVTKENITVDKMLAS